MPRGVRKLKDEVPHPLEYCHICGHLLAERNETGKCYRHPPKDSPTQSPAIIIIRPPAPFPSDHIINAVCQFFKHTLSDLQMVDKVETRRSAQKALMFLLPHDGHMRLKDAGKILNRDYHAVRFAIQEIRTELRLGSEVAQNILKIRTLYLTRRV